VVRNFLEARGFVVREEPFAFQPIAVEALPILGAGIGWLALLELPFLLLPSLSGGYGGALWVAGLTALGTVVWAVATGARIPGAAVRQDANLLATLGDSPVRRWIVAHVDTKAQGHSMAGRLVAVWLLILAVAGITALLAWRMAAGPPPGGAVAAAAGLVSAAGLLASRGRLSGGSPGARDNATGLLAALVAADARVPGIGFLFTGAEEFSLAGARAYAESGVDLGGSEWVNLDTLTDRGRLYLVSHDRSGADLADRIAPLLRALDIPLRKRRLPAGVLVDSVALSRAGAQACTISRLDWQDFRLIHTSRDSLDGLDPATAIRVGGALTRVG
jgi:hypothetical protein